MNVRQNKYFVLLSIFYQAYYKYSNAYTHTNT